MILISVMSAVATLIAAVAAIASWSAAHTANGIAESLANLEEQRRHAELTPKFAVSIDAYGDASLRMWVQLIGPPGLDQLDDLVFTIRDNIRDIPADQTGAATAENIENQIWGPYRLAQDIDGVTANGRTARAQSLLLGDACAFILDETQPPSWWNAGGAAWTSEYKYLPIRLSLLCRRIGYEPWTVPVQHPDYSN